MANIPLANIRFLELLIELMSIYILSLSLFLCLISQILTFNILPKIHSGDNFFPDVDPRGLIVNKQLSKNVCLYVWGVSPIVQFVHSGQMCNLLTYIDDQWDSISHYHHHHHHHHKAPNQEALALFIAFFTFCSSLYSIATALLFLICHPSHNLIGNICLSVMECFTIVHYFWSSKVL